MNVFWKQKPLAAPQAKVLTLILKTHEQCAMRDNISTVTVRNTAIGNGVYTNAVAAALLTVGATHAPLIAAFGFLAQFNPELHEKIQRVTDELHARSKMVYPNLACYTAAAGMIIGIPMPILPWIFIQGRLSAWSREFFNTIASHNAPRRRQPSTHTDKEAA